MSEGRARPAVPTIRLVAVALAIGVSLKLAAFGVVALLAGIDAARPLTFPGLGLLLALLAYPLVRRRWRSG